MLPSRAMSDAFVDLTWRGLDVGRRVKLHAIRAGSGYLDHGTPMPVGTVLVIKTDDGVEIPATVRRVHEQVGGSAETPGMQVVPTLEGAAAAWWLARVEAEPAAAAAVESADEATVVEAVPEDGGRTQVMPALTEADLAAMEAAAAGSGNGEIHDDGRRTTVMAAVDVAAIVEAAGAEPSGPIDVDDDGPSQDGPSQDGPSQDGPSQDGRSNGAATPRGKRNRRNTGKRKKR